MLSTSSFFLWMISSIHISSSSPFLSSVLPRFSSASYTPALTLLLKVFSSRIFLSIELKRFFTWFSVRPGISFAIYAHWLPISLCFSKSMRSSLGVQGSLLISGERKLIQRSLHYFPCLLFVLIFLLISLAISCHYFCPRSATSYFRS